MQSILHDFNNIHPNLNFTFESETYNSLNYLDIAIHRTNTNLNFHIFRKPTFTDSINPQDTCHPPPPEHKNAAIRYLYNRLHTYDLSKEAKANELNTILNIMHNKKYPPQTFKSTQKEKNLNNPNNICSQAQEQEQKWVNFTYVGKETRAITQIFRNTNLKISYKTNNTIESLLKEKQTHFDKYSASGVYKLICPDCGRAYVGQTGRSFSVKYKEHHLSYRTNNTNSSYAQHLLENSHTFASIDKALHILEFQKKSTHMNTLERFYIHREAFYNNH
jgi:hypothetical protein